MAHVDNDERGRGGGPSASTSADAQAAESPATARRARYWPGWTNGTSTDHENGGPPLRSSVEATRVPSGPSTTSLASRGTSATATKRSVPPSDGRSGNA